MHLPLVKSAKPVSPQRLQDANINICVKIVQKIGALDFYKITESVDIKIQQLLAQLQWQIGLGIVQKGSDVILQRAFAPALIIQEKRLPALQHDIARLEVAIHEIVAVGAQQKIHQTIEIVFQRLFAERNPDRKST